MSGRLAALDLGSGTIKLSVFEGPFGAGGPLGRPYTALCLDEANTELRKGMGPERTLKPGPLAETLAACAAFQKQARALGVERLPAYATSAVRKAKNPEALLGPLKAMGIEVRILGEEDEGRLNLLGALARARDGRADGAPLHDAMLVIDPGGDSTECTADLDGMGWETATVASLPFGSVSLQERCGSAADNVPLEGSRLRDASQAAQAMALAHAQFSRFVGVPLIPAIRMNLPIQRALEQVNGRALTAHGEGGTYSRAELEALTRHTASLDHAGRAALLAGEPIGKVDRTCYGFASWLGILDALGADRFAVEPWGIKLGAVIALNTH